MRNCKNSLIAFLMLLLVAGTPIAAKLQTSQSYQGIMPYVKNSWYWQYQGKPIVLIGASDDDNLFQWPGKTLTDHLDTLVASGGNFLRNTISDREVGNIFAFKKISDTQYDLNQWNDEYWNRLTFFLDETIKRGIMVQVSLWDHFDITADFRWAKHPWNPANNVNMGTDTWQNGRDFYTTVNRNDTEGLRYQNQFIDKLLSVTTKYNHVTYNINNESDESPEWELYWGRYLKEAGKKVNGHMYVTTLQFDPANAVRFAMTHDDVFDYVEVSQNNQDSRGGRGPAHYENLMWLRQKLANAGKGPRPMNNEKIYGGKEGFNWSAGSESEAINRFWRNIFGGCAAVRFHRPAGDVAPWGSGLNPRTQRTLKSMSMLLEEFDIVSSAPYNDLLIPRVPVNSTHEAYLSANIGSQYAIFFPQGRHTVSLDPWVYTDQVRIKWLDIENSEWSESEIIDVQWEGGHHDWGYRGRIHLETPANRACVALIEVIK